MFAVLLPNVLLGQGSFSDEAFFFVPETPELLVSCLNVVAIVFWGEDFFLIGIKYF